MKSNHPFPADFSNLNHGKRQSCPSHLPGLPSTGPIITHFRPSNTDPPVFREPPHGGICRTVFRRSVALYPCVCVLLMRRAMQHTPTPSSTFFFRTPVAGKRRDTYRNIFLVRVFPFFLSPMFYLHCSSDLRRFKKGYFVPLNELILHPCL